MTTPVKSELMEQSAEIKTEVNIKKKSPKSTFPFHHLVHSALKEEYSFQICFWDTLTYNVICWDLSDFRLVWCWTTSKKIFSKIIIQGYPSPQSDVDSITDLEQLKASLKLPASSPINDLYEGSENLNDLLQIKQVCFKKKQFSFFPNWGFGCRSPANSPQKSHNICVCCQGFAASFTLQLCLLFFWTKLKIFFSIT